MTTGLYIKTIKEEDIQKLEDVLYVNNIQFEKEKKLKESFYLISSISDENIKDLEKIVNEINNEAFYNSGFGLYSKYMFDYYPYKKTMVNKNINAKNTKEYISDFEITKLFRNGIYENFEKITTKIEDNYLEGMTKFLAETYNNESVVLANLIQKMASNIVNKSNYNGEVKQYGLIKLIYNETKSNNGLKAINVASEAVNLLNELKSKSITKDAILFEIAKEIENNKIEISELVESHVCNELEKQTLEFYRENLSTSKFMGTESLDQNAILIDHEELIKQCVTDYVGYYFANELKYKLNNIFTNLMNVIEEEKNNIGIKKLKR